MAKLQPVRGTRDLMPEDARRHRHVVECARRMAERFGYLQIDTPVFEFTEVFARTLGETSEIVTKEMYTFETKGGESLTLRPEGTAGIVRALISGGLQQELPLKFFYHGPMFRHERPQKGRLRQFHQIGVELLGVGQPLGDVEVISLGVQVLDALGVLGATTLHLNTLGDGPSRAAYRAALVAYFSQHETRLSADGRTRLELNPLRILDSKDEGDRAVIADAPEIGAHLTPEAQEFFDHVRRGLDDLGIAYVVNPRLVRGLDYYCHSAFEFITDELGAQGTVLAGGRYDGLVETMGGPATPGVGWAAGIERLGMLTAPPPEPPRPIAVVPIGEDAEATALKITDTLRLQGLHVDLGFGGSLRTRMKRANKLNARAAVLIGEDELARDAATVRDLDSGEQTEVPLARLADHLAAFRQSLTRPD